MENWEDIQEYEGYYQVSNLGNIRSVDRYVSSGAFRKGTNINTYVHKNGYSYVTLRKNGSKRNFKVHQLVVCAFLGKPSEGKEIDHINTNRCDNKLSNLRLVSHSENVANPPTRLNMSKAQYASSSQRGKFGSKHPAARAVIGINSEGKEVYYSAICEAKKDGFRPKNISAVLRGERPHHKGYIFRYAK